MAFFDSDIVRSEMVKISDLQENIYSSVFTFPHMGRDKKLEHVEMLEDLLNTQKILYTRLSLSDDPDAIHMKEQIAMTAEMMGFSKGDNIYALFNTMETLINTMREQIDKTSPEM